MKTIHKLVLKSYLGPMFLTFFIVMFVLMMNFIWRYIDELVGKGLDAGVIIELMSYAMPAVPLPSNWQKICISPRKRRWSVR